jgi:hypothetical protein
MGQAMYLRRRFAHEGRLLEVRATLYSRVWHMAVFENGVLVTDQLSRVSEHDVDFARRKQGVDLLHDSLVEVQKDVESGRLRLPQNPYATERAAS